MSFGSIPVLQVSSSTRVHALIWHTTLNYITCSHLTRYTSVHELFWHTTLQYMIPSGTRDPERRSDEKDQDMFIGVVMLRNCNEKYVHIHLHLYIYICVCFWFLHFFICFSAMLKSRLPACKEKIINAETHTTSTRSFLRRWSGSIPGPTSLLFLMSLWIGVARKLIKIGLFLLFRFGHLNPNPKPGLNHNPKPQP